MKQLIPLLVLFSGCASNLTIQEIEARDWRRGIDLENWNMCEKVYLDHGRATFHKDHMHGKRDPIRAWMIASDLRVNQCKSVLRDYWIEY